MNIDEPHVFTAKRLVEDQQDAVGGPVQNYTTAARGSLPKKFNGRAVRLSAKEKIDHGVRGQNEGWKILSSTDPQITLLDQITFEYVPDESHTLKVLIGSRARRVDGGLYKIICEEDSTER